MKNIPGDNARGKRAAASEPYSNPLSSGAEEAHLQALKEIEARGESPEHILSAFDEMDRRLRNKHLGDANEGVDHEGDEGPSWSIGHGLFFDESVAAGFPAQSQALECRKAEISDLLQSVSLDGKLLVKISDALVAGSCIQTGDTVLVDPEADLEDGDWALARVGGVGQVVKRVRVVEGVGATLESDNPSCAPINISMGAGVRVYGKVVWRCGPLR